MCPTHHDSALPAHGSRLSGGHVHLGRRTLTLGGLAVLAGLGAAPAAAAEPTTVPVDTVGPHPVQDCPLAAADVRGFAGGHLFWPADATAGADLGIVVTFPGFAEPGAVMHGIARRFASHGFAVLCANSFAGVENPTVRATMIRAAVDAAPGLSAWSDVVDGDRVALVGHSMGGGGALIAAESLDVRAVIGVHPWTQTPITGVTAPTLIVAGGIDQIAPAAEHAVPIYRGLTSVADRGLFTHHLGTHWAGVTPDRAILPRMTAFLRLFLDGDEAYRSAYLAPAPALTSFETTTRG